MVDRIAEAGFGAGADAYEAARPGYPDEVFALLANDLGLGPHSDVCDLAAGTGKFTAGLVGLGARVVAVEPVAAMAEHLSAAHPTVDVRAGTAEDLPLPDASVDLVTAAQAFHWFDPVPALAEIRRVLRPGGALVVVWNVRDERVDWVHRFTECLVEGSGGRPYTPYHGEGIDGVPIDLRFAVVTENGFGPIHATSVDNPQVVTPAQVVGRAASTSFVAALPADDRERVLADVRELIDRHPQTSGRDRFVFPHRTDLFWCRVETG